MHIYHIILPELRDSVEVSKSYAADSLATEGFIHCSFSEQLQGVIDRYYTHQNNLVILTIDTDKLTSELIVEPSTNDEEYPHIYGEINRDAIIEFKELNKTT